MKRVLIVDDEADFGSTLKSFLEGTGRWQVRTETSGLAAQSAALEFKPDLILLDFMMRDCAGPRAAALVREKAELAQVPIVFVTATAQDDSEGSIAGHPFIAKPVKLDEIEKKLQKHVAA